MEILNLSGCCDQLIAGKEAKTQVYITQEINQSKFKSTANDGWDYVPFEG